MSELKLVDRIHIEGDEYESSDNEGWPVRRRRAYVLNLWKGGVVTWEEAE